MPPWPAWLACGAALALAAACGDKVTTGQCFEPNATAYNFDFNGDTNVVFHWPSSYMPLRVYAESAGALRANTRIGMDLWASAFRCGELSYTMVTDSTIADIVVRNPVSLPVAAHAARVMHADSVGACQGLTQFATDTVTGTTLTGPMRSYIAAFPGFDSAAVAGCYHFVTAHELGHALGLLSESPYPGDLMYAVPTRLALTESDRYSIQLLYHVASKLQPPPRR
ncbi:MAG TPA: matrixin family metalloprotease [Gemmatimonadales bacterium]|nr:matrixin family metalloprotease [Gemmatimonadales bacterium]